MKKFMFMAAAAALALSSCSSDEELVQAGGSDLVDNGAVMFSAYTARGTRVAADATNFSEVAGIANAGGFGVFAYEQGRSSFSTFSASTSYPNFMYNQNVWAATDATGATKMNVSSSPYNEGASVAGWGYSPVKYYSNNEGAKHSFFAYAPFRGSGVTPVFSLGKAPQIRYNVRENYDLMWATPVLDKEKAGVTEKINFNFQHALSKVKFHVAPFIDKVHDTHAPNTIGSTTLAKHSKVTVKSIRFVGNVPSQALLDLQTGMWTIENTQEGEYLVNVEDFYWNATADALPINAYKTSPQTPTAEKTDFIKVIPSTGVKIEIVYDVDTKHDSDDATQTSANNSHVTNTVVSKEVFNLEGGKAYDFYLDLGLTSVQFNATMTNWADAGAQTVDLPNNHNFHAVSCVSMSIASTDKTATPIDGSVFEQTAEPAKASGNAWYNPVTKALQIGATTGTYDYDSADADKLYYKDGVFYVNNGENWDRYEATAVKFTDKTVLSSDFSTVVNAQPLVSLTPDSQGQVQHTDGTWHDPTDDSYYSVGSFLYIKK